MSGTYKFLAEQWIRSAWSVRSVLIENELNCCAVRKVDDDDSECTNVKVQNVYHVK